EPPFVCDGSFLAIPTPTNLTVEHVLVHHSINRTLFESTIIDLSTCVASPSERRATDSGRCIAPKREAIETRAEVRMSNQKDTLGGLADRNFLAVLPISDGVVTIRAMSDADAEAYAAGTNDASVKHFAHLPLDKYTPQIVRDMIRGAIADGL